MTKPTAAPDASRKSVISFVLGMISVVCCPIPIMLVAAVAGLLLERESEHLGEHHLQKPARILCILGIILCSMIILAILVFVLTAGILSRG